MLTMLYGLTLAEAAAFFLVANAVIFAGSVILCRGLGSAFKGKRVFERWEPLRGVEMAAALGAVVLNAAVSVVGWLLWKAGHITLHGGSVSEAWLHFGAMLLFMDFGMYVFHRLAHTPLIFRWMHSFHHRHEATNPISLFVLHPVEVIGFGALMICYLMVVPMEISGLMGYLAANVLWGTLGHSGVEPFPARLSRIPILGLLGTSTFHAEHHEHTRFNFGFYTLIWDRLFGTLDPEYERRFRQEG